MSARGGARLHGQVVKREGGPHRVGCSVVRTAQLPVFGTIQEAASYCRAASCDVHDLLNHT